LKKKAGKPQTPSETPPNEAANRQAVKKQRLESEQHLAKHKPTKTPQKSLLSPAYLAVRNIERILKLPATAFCPCQA
jgi:hypothetical protein